LNLAEGNFWNEGNEATIGFLRHSEIKHGRVAMAGFVGFCLAANGIHFPWAPIGGGFTSDSTNPGELWDSIPTNAKLQIFGLIGLLEWWSELGERVGQPPHYMRGGKPGFFPPFKGPEVSIAPHVMPLGSLYDPFGFSKNKSEVGHSESINSHPLFFIHAISSRTLRPQRLAGAWAKSTTAGWP
jgi:hypothetical protein